MEWTFLKFRTDSVNHVYVRPEAIVGFRHGSYAGTGTEYTRLYLVGGNTIDVVDKAGAVARMLGAPTK